MKISAIFGSSYGYSVLNTGKKNVCNDAATHPSFKMSVPKAVVTIALPLIAGVIGGITAYSNIKNSEGANSLNCDIPSALSLLKDNIGKVKRTVTAETNADKAPDVDKKELNEAEFLKGIFQMIEKTAAESSKSSVDFSSETKTAVDEQTKNVILLAAKKTDWGSHNSTAVKEIEHRINACPDIVKQLLNAKDSGRYPLFEASDIATILFNCSDTIENNPKRITQVLNDKDDVKFIENFRCRGAGLWRVL